MEIDDIILGYVTDKPKQKSVPVMKTFLEERDITVHRDYYDDIKASIRHMFHYCQPVCERIIRDSLDHVNDSHAKYHLESYGWHGVCCGMITAQKALQNGGDPVIGFQLGFLHDIGKPFCETKIGITFGHGQVGAHVAQELLQYIEPELREVLLFIIDQHMCECALRPGDYPLNYQVLNAMMSHWTDRQKALFRVYWAALVTGDRCSAIPLEHDSTPIAEGSEIGESSALRILSDGVEPPKLTGKIILVMHGAPGCGKSTAAMKISDALKAHEDSPSIYVCERDYRFYVEACKRKLVNFADVTFEQYISEEVVIDDVTKTRYKHFYPILRKSIADSYLEAIMHAKERNDIVVVDSCVSLDPRTLIQYVSQEDTVITWMGFPQHMFGRGGSLKVEEQTSYPLSHEGSFYRSVLEGAGPKQNYRPLFNTFSVESIVSYIRQAWKNREPYVPKVLCHPVKFLRDGTHTIQQIAKENSYTLLESPGAYIDSTKRFTVYRLGYRDGTQHGNGITINFRGEHVLYDSLHTESLEKSWFPLRVSLPVTPETGQMRSFQSHAGVFNYLVNLKTHLEREFTQPPFLPEKSEFTRCYSMPKVDGSLLVVAIFRKDSVQSEYLNIKKDVMKHFLQEIKGEKGDYTVVIGTKSCLTVAQCVGEIYDAFKETLIATRERETDIHDAVKDLCQQSVRFVEEKDYPWTETISVIYESVPREPLEGLTVKYSEPSITYLATVYYTDGIDGTQIRLPEERDRGFFRQIAMPTEMACTPESIEDFYVHCMTQALEGRFDDLEGLMLAFTTEPDEAGFMKLRYVKLKFPWYYAAHKPYIHWKESEVLMNEPKYERIKDRLVNLSTSMALREARRDPLKLFKNVVEILVDRAIEFDETFHPTNKKEYFETMSAHKEFFTDAPGLGEAIDRACEQLKIVNDLNVSKICPILYEYCIVPYNSTRSAQSKSELVERLGEKFMQIYNVVKKF